MNFFSPHRKRWFEERGFLLILFLFCWISWTWTVSETRKPAKPPRSLRGVAAASRDDGCGHGQEPEGRASAKARQLALAEGPAARDRVLARLALPFGARSGLLNQTSLLFHALPIPSLRSVQIT